MKYYERLPEKGFIKTTDHRPTHPPTNHLPLTHQPTDPPTTYPPIHRLTIIEVVKTEDQIQNIFFVIHENS